MTTSRSPMFKSVFASVGTTKFNDFVLQMLSSEVLQALRVLGCKRLVIQAGKSDLPTVLKDSANSLAIDVYDYKDSIRGDIQDADLVISHAGAGTTLEVLRIGKPLVVVINSSLMDNHQEELARQLQRDEYLTFCYPETLSETLASIAHVTFKPFPQTDTTTFAKFVDQVMGFS